MALKDDPAEKVLFADNVGFQQAQDAHEACRDLNTVVDLLAETALKPIFFMIEDQCSGGQLSSK